VHSCENEISGLKQLVIESQYQINELVRELSKERKESIAIKEKLNALLRHQRLLDPTLQEETLASLATSLNGRSLDAVPTRERALTKGSPLKVEKLTNEELDHHEDNLKDEGSIDASPIMKRKLKKNISFHGDQPVFEKEMFDSFKLNNNISTYASKSRSTFERILLSKNTATMSDIISTQNDRNLIDANRIMKDLVRKEKEIKELKVEF
jgi:hypothetical protein